MARNRTDWLRNATQRRTRRHRVPKPAIPHAAKADELPVDAAMMSDPLLSELLKMAQHETHLIVLPQWSARVTIIIGGNHEQHLEVFKRRRVGKDDSVAYADFLRDGMRHNAAVVLLPKSRPGAQFVYFPIAPDLNKAETVGTVSHEILHVTVAILRRAEVRLTDAAEETYTYLHGHLMQEFWKKLLSKGKR